MEALATWQSNSPRLADVNQQEVCHGAVSPVVPVDAVGRAQDHVVAEVVVKVKDVVSGCDDGLLGVEVALDDVQAQNVLAEPVEI